MLPARPSRATEHRGLPREATHPGREPRRRPAPPPSAMAAKANSRRPQASRPAMRRRFSTRTLEPTPRKRGKTGSFSWWWNANQARERPYRQPTLSLILRPPRRRVQGRPQRSEPVGSTALENRRAPLSSDHGAPRITGRRCIRFQPSRFDEVALRPQALARDRRQRGRCVRPSGEQATRSVMKKIPVSRQIPLGPAAPRVGPSGQGRDRC